MLRARRASTGRPIVVREFPLSPLDMLRTALTLRAGAVRRHGLRKGSLTTERQASSKRPRVMLELAVSPTCLPRILGNLSSQIRELLFGLHATNGAVFAGRRRRRPHRRRDETAATAHTVVRRSSPVPPRGSVGTTICFGARTVSRRTLLFVVQPACGESLLRVVASRGRRPRQAGSPHDPGSERFIKRSDLLTRFRSPKSEPPSPEFRVEPYLWPSPGAPGNSGGIRNG